MIAHLLTCQVHKYRWTICPKWTAGYTWVHIYIYKHNIWCPIDSFKKNWATHFQVWYSILSTKLPVLLLVQIHRQRDVIPSTKEIMFTTVFICVLAGLFVSSITQKPLNRFPPKLCSPLSFFF